MDPKLTPRESELVVNVPTPGSYEARSWFVRYQALLGALASAVAIMFAVGKPMMDYRDDIRDTKREFREYRDSQAAKDLRNEQDARRTNDAVSQLIGKVDTLLVRLERVNR